MLVELLPNLSYNVSNSFYYEEFQLYKTNIKLQEIQRCLKLDGMKDKEMLSKANKSNKSCKQKAFIQKRM